MHICLKNIKCFTNIRKIFLMQIIIENSYVDVFPKVDYDSLF